MGASEVAKGAAWLDENFPGWEREIDLGTLNINDSCNCVLGQSLAKYIPVTRAETGYEFGTSYAYDYGHTDDVAMWAFEHGFLSKRDEGVWRDLIKERFSTGNLSDA